jgi:hypothetical protein
MPQTEILYRYRDDGKWTGWMHAGSGDNAAEIMSQLYATLSDCEWQARCDVMQYDATDGHMVTTKSTRLW